MYLLGIPATIMSLGGIAIAIGATVDAEIVMVEAAHKKLETAPPTLHARGARAAREAAREVTPAIFFSLLIIAVSSSRSSASRAGGRLFRPLAYTKTFVMLSAALLSVTVAPALRDYLMRGKIYGRGDHPVSRAIRAVYEPFVHVALRNPDHVLIGLMAVLSALPSRRGSGRSSCRRSTRATCSTCPRRCPTSPSRRRGGSSSGRTRSCGSFPEVESVLGKAGRAETPTDPAPLSMFETVVRLKPARRSGAPATCGAGTWAGAGPGARRSTPWLARVRAHDARGARPGDEPAAALAGWTNAFTQPIRNRIDMLTTGIRTPVGIKVYGQRPRAIERTGTASSASCTRPRHAERASSSAAVGGLYVDIVPDRAALARYGLQVEDVNEVIEMALGGAPVTTTVEGRGASPSTCATPRTSASLDRPREVLIPLPMRRGAGGDGEPAARTDGARSEELGVADVSVVTGRR
jgi:Cu(I)/Ag(I) efflux system membrane protein CusA/SilA